MGLISKAISELGKLALGGVLNEAQRQKEALRLCKKLFGSPSTYPSDFDGCYAWTLVEYGVGKPKEILAFFDHQDIRNAFRHSFASGDSVHLDTGAHKFIDQTAIGDELRAIKIDLRTELAEFTEVFNAIVDYSRSMPEARQERKLDEVLAILRKETPPPTPEFRLHNVPDLPPNFQPRPDELRKLREAVLSGTNPRIVVTGAKRKIALHGMGGIGKTVMAIALVHEPRMKETFPGGIYWVTIGREPKLMSLQSLLIEALGGGHRTFDDASHGRFVLRELFSDRACVLILDDVWDAKHVAPFDALGERCRMVVTTRNDEIVAALGAFKNRIDILSPPDALGMLARYSEQPVESLPPEAGTVAKECGYLPIALAAIGAVLRGKPDRWPVALHTLLSHDLEHVRIQFPDCDYPNLLRAIEVSVEALALDYGEQFPGIAERYFDLAVFPEDTPVPEAVVEVLWGRSGLDSFATKQVIDHLVDRSLASRDTSGRIHLHDLLFDYVRNKADDLRTLHNRLLDSYKSRCANGWPTGPNDGYFFDSLIHHLVQAGHEDEGRSLLVNLEWLQARLNVSGSAALVGDYDAFSHDSTLQLLRDALCLSAHILSHDRSQLRPHLLGRLMGTDSPEMTAVLHAAKLVRAGPWLCPSATSLTPAGGPLLRTLRGHQGRVWAVALTADGGRAVSGAEDMSVRVWDVARGLQLHALYGHLGRIWGVALTADGKRAISGSVDGRLKVWDVELGQELRELRGHVAGVNAVALTADGGRAISGSADGTVRVWDPVRGVSLHTLRGHADEINAVAVTANGSLAVSGSEDGSVKVWDVVHAVERSSLWGHKGRVWAVALTADGRRAISGSSDRTLKVWDVVHGTQLHTLRGHEGEVNAVAVTADGGRAVSGSDDATVRVWDLTLGKELRTLRGHGRSVWAVGVTGDGRRAVSGSDDGTVRVWNLASSSERHESLNPAAKVLAVAVTADGHRAVSGSADGTVRIWDARRAAALLTMGNHGGLVQAVAVTADGKRVMTGSVDGKLKVWDVTTCNVLHTLCGHERGINAMAVATAGVQAITGSGDGTVRVWDLARGKELRVMRGHKGWVLAVALMPDGQRAISGGEDGTVKVWDVANGVELRTLRCHGGWVLATAMSGDGHHVVSGSDDGTLKVWDVERGEELCTLRGHMGRVNGVALSANGRQAFSGSDDGTVKVWDARGGQLICSFWSESEVTSVALAADNVTVVTGDTSGAVHFLKLMDA